MNGIDCYGNTISGSDKTDRCSSQSSSSLRL